VKKHTTIAVDLAKNVFEVGISEHPGHLRQSYRLSRSRFLRFMALQDPARVVMEACGSAHYWARQLEAQGHRVRLLSPMQVRPYVGRNKTDRSDVKGLLEADRNTAIRPVPVKTLEQQQMTTLHRVRSGWMHTRTARLNAVRGLLRELGYAIPVGAGHVVPRVRELIEDAETEIPAVSREMFHDLCEEIRDLEARIGKVEREIKALGGQDPAVVRLLTIPGVGVLTATALVAFVGDVERFASSRHFASYLGLTPREYSSGSRRYLGRISKQGDVYLRTLLIHGARSVLGQAQRRPGRDPFHDWGGRLLHRRGWNKAAVAVANRLARIAWAVWKRNDTYRVRPLLAASPETA